MRNLPDLKGIPDLPDAACRGFPLEMFFPAQPIESKDAKALCKLCPEQTACLQWALDHHPQFGIWAGTTEEDRRKMKLASSESFCHACGVKVNPKFNHCEACRREQRRAKDRKKAA